MMGQVGHLRTGCG